MRVRSNVVTVLSSLAMLSLLACGSGSKKQAQAPEGNLWAGYQGTYAGPVAAKGDAPAKADKTEKTTEKTEKTEKTATKEAKVEKTDDAAAAPKASKGTIKGESVSSIDLDTFADASKAAIKAKVVSTKYVVGPKYEEMQIQLKGATVQVIRPSANPASDGPAISSPKARNSEISKTESGWYDEEADVLVVVTAAKKPAAQKALGTILKH